ncbi:MAG: hypothetical protein HZB31_02995 [Nitrospirae bacterium]|nr:hypothetical protein [Nitrospirota bacterium]
MKKMYAVLVIVLILGMSMGISSASEHRRTYESERRHNGHDVKIYGIVDKMPEGGIGTWIVKGKEILVTKATHIKERHGRVSAGTYVEVKGTYSGNTLQADEIEVKRDKR